MSWSSSCNRRVRAHASCTHVNRAEVLGGSRLPRAHARHDSAGRMYNNNNDTKEEKKRFGSRNLYLWETICISHTQTPATTMPVFLYTDGDHRWLRALKSYRESSFSNIQIRSSLDTRTTAKMFFFFFKHITDWSPTTVIVVQLFYKWFLKRILQNKKCIIIIIYNYW